MATVDLTPEDQALVDRVRKDFDRAKKRHEPFRLRCEERYRKYRSFQEHRRHYTGNARDRDEVIRSAKREWGAELFIPYAFSVVETILPRMLSANPVMTLTPPDPRREGDVESVELLLKRQQDNIDYPIRLQDVGKSGLIYGLGVQKTTWRSEYKEKPVLEKAIRPINGEEWTVSAPTKQLSFDDPWAEAVDIWDFFWDPYASGVEDAEFLIHRTWRSTRYVKRMLETGTWDCKEWDQAELLESGPVDRRDDVWRGRDLAGGYGAERKEGASGLHEVWEWHDGTQVITILDGKWPVQAAPNPYWHGEMPFQIYRPTKVPNEFTGIGEIEPIEDLQEEMNTLRSQRRDNATLKLQQVFSYMEGMVDPSHLKFGPGMAIPVMGPPGELLQQINVGDIPNSGYQEEANLTADIVRTTGIDDSQVGMSNLGGAQTATGAQLVQASANVRIQQKTLLLATEVVKPAARQWFEMNQQKIRSSREIPGPPKPEEAEKRWSWYQVGPEELEGEWGVDVLGLSMQPDNVPQKRSDGEQLFNMFAGNVMVDQKWLYSTVLAKFDVREPDSHLRAAPPVPAQGAPGAPAGPEGAQGPEGAPGPQNGAGGPQEGPPSIPPQALTLIVQGLESHGMKPHEAQALVLGAIAHAREIDAGQLSAPEPSAPSGTVPAR